MDPFTTGLMSLFAANNPEQAAPMLNQLGLPVPKLQGEMPGTGMGSTMTPAAQGELPWAPDGGAGVAAPQSQAGTGGPTVPNIANAAMQGVKAAAPIQPVMSGGVAGGVKAPEVQKMQSGSPAIQSLMAALLGGGGHMPVPTLGEYIRGGKY